MGGHAAVGALAAVGGVAHFTCNFSILVGLAVGGSCCAPYVRTHCVSLQDADSSRKATLTHCAL